VSTSRENKNTSSVLFYPAIQSINKRIARLLIRALTVFCLASLTANNVLAFELKLDGWREFKFGESWADAKEKLSKNCQTQDGFKDDIFGQACGYWLGLPVNVRIISHGGIFLGFGKKLDALEVSTPFSDNSANKVLKYLRSYFEQTRDYDCWLKEVDKHYCTIMFKNGAVIFEDRLNFGGREIAVSIMAEEIYRPGAFK